jgi:S-DNA-T family DNA segregation ATPase FtsK/SpoIIIE
MAKNSSPKKNNASKGKAPAKGGAAAPAAAPTWQERLVREMLSLLCLGLAAFLLLALWTYHQGDPQGLVSLWDAPRVQNEAGKVGALLAAGLLWALGVAAFWLPFMVMGLAWQSHARGLEAMGPGQWAASLGVLLASAAFLGLTWPFINFGGDFLPSGGKAGKFLAAACRAHLESSGAYLALVVLLLVSFMGMTRMSLVNLLIALGHAGRWLWRRLRGAKPPEPEPVPPKAAKEKTPRPIIAKSGVDPDEPVMAAPGPKPEITGPASAAPPASPRRGKGAAARYVLPPLELLDPAPPWNHQVQESAMLAQAQKLEETLRHFGVEGRVASIMNGPVVSRFEYEPALGVKISKITGLADDLALALKALSIRIVAPVPGKGVLGIEIPNPKRQVVAFRDILADAAYQKSASRLTLALGKDIMGTPVVTDLAKMPHLLIAGATGSGKSVGLNAMLLSILYKATPEEVRVLLIDPKRIELSTYEGIPHLLHPVVFNPKEATLALHWAVGEMERRYALLSDLNVRNIDGYNQKAKTHKGEPVLDGILPETLPYLVIVIDELADLMLVSSRDTEEYLIRLAQKARASGIHLLVATQRPSVDVITGLIKANFPTRISYQVSAKPDSRVILDTIGAERLLGMGDMLFMPPGTSRLKRIHGAYVSDQEVVRVVEHLKAQAAPDYEPGITDLAEQEEEAAETGERDEKFDLAVELVAETRNASISMLQRRLRIGYNRAARIIETMEKEGMIGPSDGLKPREVYIPRR